MSFLNPWAIAIGVMAAGLPVLIHWLTRPRPVVLSFSALRFIRLAVEQRRARHRLRDWLVLALRTAAVLLLAGAIARPLSRRRPLISNESMGDAARVVIVDVSQSMAARAGGIRAFERARSLAANHLAYRPGLTANLVLAGASARPVLDGLSGNFAALRDELGRASPRPERLNVAAALNSAARMLARARDGKSARRELVIISDFQRTQWSAADFSVIPRETAIQLEFVAPAEALPNLAISRVGSSARAELGRPIPVEVEVRNDSPNLRQIQVELTIAETTSRLEGACGARSKTTLSAEVIPRVLGWQTGQARLLGVNDALAEDDVRSFAIEVRPPPVEALITRQGAAARPSSSYFLERALAPFAGRDDQKGERVTRIDPAQADRDSLAGADAIVLDHPGKLADEVVLLLAGLLRRGRGVLYVAAEPVDAVNLKRLADAAGTDLRLPVVFAPPPAGAFRGPLFLADFRRDDAPFRIFGDEATSAFAPLRFSGGLSTRPLPDALAEDVRAAFSDRTACLVVSACGAGTLAILNADLRTSTLATSPVFVPFLEELKALLLGHRGIDTPAPCGEPTAVPLPAAAGPSLGLRIVGPAAMGTPARDDGELVEDREGVLWRINESGPPGVYLVKREDRTVFALATAIPEPESDLTSLRPEVIQARLMGEHQAYYRDAAQADDQVDGSWAWLAVVCVACLGAELITLRAFRI